MNTKSPVDISAAQLSDLVRSVISVLSLVLKCGRGVPQRFACHSGWSEPPEHSTTFMSLVNLLPQAGRWLTIATSLVLVHSPTSCKSQDRPDVIELQVDESQAVLDTLGKLASENYAKLATFKAEYSIEDVTQVRSEVLQKLDYEVPESPGPWQRKDTGIVKVRYDAARESVYSEVVIANSSLVKDATGKPIDQQLRPSIPQRSIVTPSVFYRFNYTSRYGDFREVPAMTGVVGRAAFREPIEEAVRLRCATVIDPRRFFGNGDNLWSEVLQMTSAMCRTEIEGKVPKPEGAPTRAISVRSIGQGEDHVYRLSIIMWKSVVGTGAGGMVFVTRFPKSSGYLCTSNVISQMKGPDVQQDSWTYRSVDGIRIPEKIGRVMLDQETQQVVSSRDLVLQNCEVNKGLSDNEISVAALGLENDERVLDRVEEKCYKYKNGQLVDPIRFDEPAKPIQTALERREVLSGFNTWLLILGNGVFLITIMAVVFMRGRQKTQ